MARKPKKTNAGIDFVGEQIRAGNVVTIDDIQTKANMGPAMAYRVVKYFRDLGILEQVGPKQFASRSVARNMLANRFNNGAQQIIEENESV